MIARGQQESGRERSGEEESGGRHHFSTERVHSWKNAGPPRRERLLRVQICCL